MAGFAEMHLLGKGAYGSAHLVQHESGARFVVKRIDTSAAAASGGDVQLAQREVDNLMRVSSAHVVRYFGSFVAAGVLHVFMELCEGGTLEQALRAREAAGIGCDVETSLDWFAQICLGVQAVHALQIVHRDLKPANVYLTRRNMAKLGDFGVSVQLGCTRQLAETCVGTPLYLSPEMLQGQPYSTATDIWSLGVLLFRCCFGKHPFAASNLPALAMRVCAGPAAEVPEGAPAELQGLLGLLLTRDPAQRPTIDEVVAHPLVARHIATLSAELAQLAAAQPGAPHAAEPSLEPRLPSPQGAPPAAAPEPALRARPCAVKLVQAVDYHAAAHACAAEHDELLLVCCASKLSARGVGGLGPSARGAGGERVAAVTGQRLLLLSPAAARALGHKARPPRRAHWLGLLGLRTEESAEGCLLELTFADPRRPPARHLPAGVCVWQPCEGELDACAGGSSGSWTVVLRVVPQLGGVLVRAIALAVSRLRRDLAVGLAAVAAESAPRWELGSTEHTALAERSAEQAAAERARPEQRRLRAFLALGAWYGAEAAEHRALAARARPLLVGPAEGAGATALGAPVTSVRLSALLHGPQPAALSRARSDGAGAARGGRLERASAASVRALVVVLGACGWLEELACDVPLEPPALDALVQAVACALPRLSHLSVLPGDGRSVRALASAASARRLELRVEQEGAVPSPPKLWRLGSEALASALGVSRGWGKRGGAQRRGELPIRRSSTAAVWGARAVQHAGGSESSSRAPADSDAGAESHAYADAHSELSAQAQVHGARGGARTDGTVGSAAAAQPSCAGRASEPTGRTEPAVRLLAVLPAAMLAVLALLLAACLRW